MSSASQTHLQLPLPLGAGGASNEFPSIPPPGMSFGVWNHVLNSAFRPSSHPKFWVANVRESPNALS